MERQSRKTSLLTEKHQANPAVIPRRWFDHVVQYWLTVRPFCCILARGLKHKDVEIERWQRFCFISASSKNVSNCVSRRLQKKAGIGANFQRLRHASEAIFRNQVVPKEHNHSQTYDFDRLFGHQYRTGLSYGVMKLIGSDEKHANTNLTSMRRCLKGWRRILGLNEVPPVQHNEIENDEFDYSSDEESDDGDNAHVEEGHMTPVDHNEGEDDDTDEESEDDDDHSAHVGGDQTSQSAEPDVLQTDNNDDFVVADEQTSSSSESDVRSEANDNDIVAVITEDQSSFLSESVRLQADENHIIAGAADEQMSDISEPMISSDSFAIVDNQNISDKT